MLAEIPHSAFRSAQYSAHESAFSAEISAEIQLCKNTLGTHNWVQDLKR